MDIVLDFGTSNGKVALYEGKSLLRIERGIQVHDLSGILGGNEIQDVIVSSVSVDPLKVMSKIEAKGKKLIMSHSLKLPIKVEYLTPNTLGTDRLAAIVGAWSRFRDTDVLVIDAGTCITFDLLNKEGKYMGGSISPGIELKFRALHNYTESLPLMKRTINAELIGDSTENSILSGVINGTIAEINEIIRMYRNKFSHLQLIICGGDANYYSKYLSADVETSPDLVLEGLKTALDYNG